MSNPSGFLLVGFLHDVFAKLAISHLEGALEESCLTVLADTCAFALQYCHNETGRP